MDHAYSFVALYKPIEFKHCNNIIERGECICSVIIISLQCVSHATNLPFLGIFATNIKETTVHYTRLLRLFIGFQKNCMWSLFWP